VDWNADAPDLVSQAPVPVSSRPAPGRSPRTSRAVLGPLALVATCALLSSLPAVAGAAGHGVRVKVSNAPTKVVPELSDAQATALIKRAPETRADNGPDNHRVPSKAQLSYFRSHNDSMPAKYLERVDGAFRGSTDEIIQWAAYKWGFDPELFRAVAAVESWWHMYTVGDEGNAFGLFQVDYRYHCCRRLAESYSAWNADYYGAMLRSYYDGSQTWLNTVTGNGSPYASGDLWGSVGYWAAGRWHVEAGDIYVAKVQADLAERVWTHANFIEG
jgi:hypothetical protein